MLTLEETALQLMRSVMDPELGLNVVDLGLIYELTIRENRARIVMTFTTMGCPVAGSLVDGIHQVLQPLGLESIEVEITFDPPWSPDRLSSRGRELLGIR